MLTFAILLSGKSFAQNDVSGQNFLNSLAGNWRSVQGYVVNYQGSSCYTPQMFYVYNVGSDYANFSYSISCSNGYQAQMQGLDFNPRIGTYQSGYNTLSSKYLYNNNVIVGIERKMTTTWGFGSMINFQYQTVKIMAVPNSNGNAITLEISNSQSNVQNGLVTTYHLDLVNN